MLPTLLCFGSWNHCILVWFLWSNNHEHSLSNHGLCSFNSYRPRLSLAEDLILSLMCSQTFFMSMLSLKFSKAANLFETLMFYCFLTSRSLSFLKLNLSTSNFCDACLFTANIFLTFAITRQQSVSQSALLKDRKWNMLKCHLPSVNIWPSWLWVFPSGEVQVYLWMFRQGNIVFLTTRFFDVAKFTILTPLSLVSWCRFPFPIVVWKYSLSWFLYWSLLTDFSHGT